MSQPTGRQPPRPTNQPISGDKPVTPSPAASTNKATGAVGSSAEQRSEFNQGQVFGQYRIVAKLGQGGMGAVYRAVHIHLQKPVALKILPADRLQNPELVARFQREMRAAGQIENAHLVRALDAGQVGKIHYLAMEYVDGLDLAKILKKTGPLPIPEACEIIRQAALGLQAIHAHGMVHRDIKPSNLMLARQLTGPPVVKILDLGLARLTQTQSSGEQLTQGHVIMGTLEYMAPEQAGHQAVDIRADIYSLGATFYAMLAGRAPFSGPQYDTVLSKLRALAVEEPTPIQDLRPDVPEELAEILERMLAKDPNMRFSTPQEVASALQPFCAEANLAPLLEGKLPRRSSDSAVPVHVASADELSLPSLSRRTNADSSRWLMLAASVTVPAVLAVVVLAVVYWLKTPRQEANGGTDVAQVPTDGPKVTPQKTPAPPGTKPVSKPGSEHTAPTSAPAKVTKPPANDTGTWTVGQGVTSVQQAVARAQPGDVIFVPEGQHQVFGTLMIGKELKIRGAGAGKSILLLSAASTCIHVTGSNVVFEGLTFQRLGTEPADLLLIHGRNVVVRDCHFRDTKAPPPTQPGQFPPPIGWGIKIAQDSSCQVSHCTFLSPKRGGVTVIHPAEAVLENNNVSDTWDGLLVLSAGQVRVARNRMEKCNTGISLGGASPAEVVENDCWQCNNGISIWGQSSARLIQNRSQFNNLNGVAIVSRGFPIIERNVFEGNRGSGAFIGEQARPTLIGNVLRANQEHGVLVTSQANPVLRANRIIQNEGYGIFVEPGADVILQDTQVLEDNKRGPIFRREVAVTDKPQDTPPQKPDSPPNPGKPLESPPAKPAPGDAKAAARTWTVGKDVPTLKEAVAKANAGDVIVLPAGKYELDEGLLVDKALEIRGAGRDKTLIVSAVPGLVVKFIGDGPWTLEGVSIGYVGLGRGSANVVGVQSGKFTARECSFSGGFRGAALNKDDAGHGIYIADADSVTISKCIIGKHEGAGIRCKGKEKGAYSIEGCTIADCEYGILIESGKCTIANTAIGKCKDSGIVITESAEAVIEACLIQENREIGIKLAKKAQAVIKKCKVLANGKGFVLGHIAGAGIVACDETVTNIEGTTCSGNRCGILYVDQAKGLCQKNTCSANRIGIALGGHSREGFGGAPGFGARVGATNATVQGNLCSGNEMDGIYVTGESKPTIRDNLCERNGRNGISVEGRATPVIRGNQCTLNRRYGIYVERTAQPELGLDNKLVQNGAGPINRD